MSENNRFANLEENEMQVDIAVKYGKGYIQQRLILPNVWDDKRINDRFETTMMNLRETKNKIDKGEIKFE